MGANTNIPWANHTHNEWLGCEKVDEACLNCYAELWAKQYGLVKWGRRAKRVMTSKSTRRKPHQWNKRAGITGVRESVFAGSLCDVCEDRPDLLAPRMNLRRTIEETENLDWLLLTKRPEHFGLFGWDEKSWPLNAWAMTTVANQKNADERIPELFKTHAHVLGLSMEPLLGPVDIHWALRGWCPIHHTAPVCYAPDIGYGLCAHDHTYRIRRVNWVIVGSESLGNKPGRPTSLEWVRSIRDQCGVAGVAFFVKQLEIAGQLVKDVSRFPFDLRIQELPR